MPDVIIPRPPTLIITSKSVKSYKTKVQWSTKVAINHTHFRKPLYFVPRCIIGANLVILAETSDKLSRRQDSFGARLSINVPNGLEGRDQLRPFSKAAVFVPRCTIGANLVILAETGDELSRGQYNNGACLFIS